MPPESFLKPLGLSIPAGEKGRLLIEQATSRPTCDVNGIIGGYTGEGSKTVIPAQASAKISFRLAGMDRKFNLANSSREYGPVMRPGFCKSSLTYHSTAPSIAIEGI